MTHSPIPPSGSYFWSLADLPGYDHPIWWVVGIALYLIGVAAMVWVSLINETAAGDGAPPADGAAPMAGSSITAAAPAPTAPAEGSGAVGVTPAFEWFDPAGRDAREAEQAAEVEAITGGGR